MSVNSRLICVFDKSIHVFQGQVPGSSWDLGGFRYCGTRQTFYVILSSLLNCSTDLQARQLHKYTVLITIQVLHTTSQHHLNLQLQFSKTVIFFCLNPLPQHRMSQPPTPSENGSHSRPLVPMDPYFRLGLQKFGEFSVYMRSSLAKGLWDLTAGMRPPWPSLLPVTRTAASKRSFNRVPTWWKTGIFFQHVLSVHDPDSPWHLHTRRMYFTKACKKRINLNYFRTDNSS